MAASLLSLQACTTTYSAEAIEAWVVDSDTGKPLEGVVVTANWELRRNRFTNTIPAGQIKVLETVTDQTGRFGFPAWGPESTPFTLNPIDPPHLENDDPRLSFFKSEYKLIALANYPSANYSTSSLRKSDWNGKTIKLERFKGALREYANNLSLIGLGFIAEDCNWMKVPTMVLALDAQYEVFRKNGIQSDLLTINGLDRRYGDAKNPCGSAVAFFKERAK